MTPALESLLLVLILATICLQFLAAIRIRELAYQAVLRASRRDQFQVLDQSVHLRRLSLSRDKNGQWRVWRQYRFDYSVNGVERQRGFVIMLGRQLQAVIVSDQDRVIH